MHTLHLPPHHMWRATLLAALAAAAAFLAMTPPDLGGSGSGTTTEFRAMPGPLPPPAWISEPLMPPTAQLAP